MFVVYLLISKLEKKYNICVNRPNTHKPNSNENNLWKITEQKPIIKVHLKYKNNQK